MKIYLGVLLAFFAISCQPSIKPDRSVQLNALAEKYVRLGLAIGQYDPDFVDAYYGPDSLKPTAPVQATFPKDSFIMAIGQLTAALNEISTGQDSLASRAGWMTRQLKAFERRTRIFSGELASFDEESRDLFGVTAPVRDEHYFRLLIAKLDSALPGQGDISTRFSQLANRFVIPKDKIDTIFRVTIAEARKRTLAHYTLPEQEDFKLEYVTGKPWSGYNWYKGNYKSLIQINTDLPILVDRAIDLACHEGYPGHHVYNMLLEKNLYRDKGWVEVSLYPLFSPQSLIAEGSANFGIEVAFPGNDAVAFIEGTLLPILGSDSMGISRYMTALSLRRELNYARNEAARALFKGTMNEEQAVKWLTELGLSTAEASSKSVSFIKKYRSYVINYNYGQDLVRTYIESKGGTPSAIDKRWELFGWLLSNQVAPADLKIESDNR